MSRTIIFTILSTLVIFLHPITTFAQVNNHTATEETKGKEIQEKLINKQVTCQKLSDDDLQALGEYYMGQMTGQSHEQMNQMMTQMMGEEGEKQMHIVMGKRLSGCEPNAQVPPSGIGFMPMMWMMRGGGGPMMGSWGGMMDDWGGFGIIGWLSMILFWGLLILGVVALLRYLTRSGQGKEDKTPVDILKERYAKGEINKKQFEEMKNGLR